MNGWTQIINVTAEPARLDAAGTAKPKTRLVDHRNPGHCFGPGMSLNRPEYEAEDGTRVSLSHQSTDEGGERITLIPGAPELVVPANPEESHTLTLTTPERDFLRRLLAKSMLLHPEDKRMSRNLLEKIHASL